MYNENWKNGNVEYIIYSTSLNAQGRRKGVRVTVRPFISRKQETIMSGRVVSQNLRRVWLTDSGVSSAR